MRFGSYLSVELTNIPPCPTKKTVKTQIWQMRVLGWRQKIERGISDTILYAPVAKLAYAGDLGSPV